MIETSSLPVRIDDVKLSQAIIVIVNRRGLQNRSNELNKFATVIVSKRELTSIG